MKWIQDRLYHWHSAVDRNMPWKNTEDPYKIWVSEIILQQTRVDQGRKYYVDFIDRFPNVRSLANANIDEVLKAWQGLGYYSRAINLHAAAGQIVENFQDKIPNDYNSLLQLKGIGAYTASAIMSFAFKQPYAVLDGNVIRVLCRLFAIEKNTSNSKTIKELQILASSLLDQGQPAKYNQAIMDFGALVCKPQNPNCATCNLQNECKAYKYDLVDSLPITKKKKITKVRYFHYFYYCKNNVTAISKRNQNDVWASLYQFPLIEWISNNITEFFQDKEFLVPAKFLKKEYTSTHLLTHQKLIITFYKVEKQFLREKIFQNQKILFIKNSQLEKFPFPRPIEQFLKNQN